MHHALLAHEKLAPPCALSLWIARPETQRPQAHIVVPMPIKPKLTSVRRVLFGDENHLFQFRWSQKIPEKPTVKFISIDFVEEKRGKELT